MYSNAGKGSGQAKFVCPSCSLICLLEQCAHLCLGWVVYLLIITSKTGSLETWRARFQASRVSSDPVFDVIQRFASVGGGPPTKIPTTHGGGPYDSFERPPALMNPTAPYSRKCWHTKFVFECARVHHVGVGLGLHFTVCPIVRSLGTFPRLRVSVLFLLLLHLPAMPLLGVA